MAHHHLLPLILSLILVILPSSSHAANQNQALFSDDGDFLVSGHNLTDGENTLSLKEDCGLYYYYKFNSSIQVKNFNTPTDATGCVLKITNSGQLEVTYAASGKVIILGNAGASGTYSLLFTKSGLAVYGPRIWDNKIQVLQTLKKKNLRETTSSNVIYSPERINGSAINGPIATNKDVSAYITPYCELSVNNTKTGKNIWNSNSASAKTGDCFLYLTSEGLLLLIQHDQKSNELITHWTGGAFAGVNDYVLLVRTSGSLEISGLMEDIREIPAYSASVAEKIKMVTAA